MIVSEPRRFDPVVSRMRVFLLPDAILFFNVLTSSSDSVQVRTAPLSSAPAALRLKRQGLLPESWEGRSS